MTTIEVIGLSKRYGRQSDSQSIEVLRDVSFRVDGVVMISCLGPNGVGKSSFLKVLAGLATQTQGQFLIDGVTPRLGHIRFVPQNCPVLPWRRVIDDICLGLEIAGYTKAERVEYARLLFDKVGVELPLRQRCYQMSGGQRQQVNLYRALVGPDRPALLLMDEPFAALDVASRMKFLAYCDTVLQEDKTPIMFTAHDLELAVLASDVIVPFKAMPVVVGNDDLIKVNLPRPRTREMLLSPEFREAHRALTERLLAFNSKSTS